MISTPELAAAGFRIVTALSGTWHNDHGLCRCPAHDDVSPSLSVRIGETSLLFKCFAGCEASSVMAALRARRCEVPRRNGPSADGRKDRSNDSSAQRVMQLWQASQSLGGTIGAAYLRHRLLHACPPALRFHPHCPVGRGSSVRFRPAIIAAVGDELRFSSLQRLFLRPDGRGLAQDMRPPKLSLGRLGTGAVRLSPAGAELGLAEGIETAMSATMLLGLPVWAVLGSIRLHGVDIPRGVRRLFLLPDNDRAGRIAAAKAQAVYARPEMNVRIEWPPDGANDWNDVLRSRG